MARRFIAQNTISIIILSVLSIWSNNIYAKSGDTTIVNTHQQVLIQTDPSRGSTNYYGWGQFPKSGSYQKMYAELSFQCPTGMTCGEWDYLNFIRIGKRKGTFNDSLGWEIMRLITPYGLGFNASWKHTWRFDITDFQQLFRDSIEIWYQHTGYEARNGRGWVINLNFFMIEGPETRPVLDIKRLYTINPPYGNDSIFDARVPEYRWKLDPKIASAAKTTRFKIIQTGHGMDKPENCAEFCPKMRYLTIDSQILDSSYVWRDDCGSNPVFPQNGTWIYDRTNWCPGQSVWDYNFEIPNADTLEHSFDLDMQHYATTSGGANYMISAYRITYGDFTHQHDVAIEEIIRPSTDPQYSRVNPMCGEPEIIVRNNGTDTSHNLYFEYGVVGGNTKNHYWTGTLSPNQKQNIRLTYGVDFTPTSNQFEVELLESNQKIETNLSNNKLRSSLPATPPLLPSKIVVLFRTNNAPSENSYRFLDAAGHIVYEKKNFATPNTINRDTFSFYNGCFTFQFSDTGIPPASYYLNEDGISWWANTADGTGTLALRNATTGQSLKIFNGDFGTDINYDFTVGYSLNNQDLSNLPTTGKIKIIPNPSQGEFGLDLEKSGINPSLGKSEISIFNFQGQLIKSIQLEPNHSLLPWISLPELSAGMYLIQVQQGKTKWVEKWMNIHQN